jgi:hypothetical protein
MSALDPQYVADALAWAVVWSGLGLTGRQLLAQHEARRRAAGSPHRERKS